MEVEVTTHWQIVTGSLTCTTVPSLENFSFDSVNPDSCVYISSDSSEQRGEILLAVKGSSAISEFLVITDCPRWEIVAGLQYLTSVQGELVDCFDGTNVYSVQLKLPKTYEQLTLRLPPSGTSCWIYSLQVVTKEIERPRVGHFDINSVNNLIGDEKQLSNKAEHFKSLFEKFQANQSSSKLSTEPPKVSDLMLNPLLLQTMMQKKPIPPSPVTDKQNSEEQFLLLKAYIDSKFKVMEENILKIVAEKDKEQNAKLDQIISQLNELKNDR